MNNYDSNKVKYISLTQEQYDQLYPKDENTVYCIQEYDSNTSIETEGIIIMGEERSDNKNE